MTSLIGLPNKPTGSESHHIWEENHMTFKDVQKMRTSTLKRFIARPTFEDEMELHSEPLLSNWSKQRIALGRLKGRREAILLVLETRGLSPTATQRERIEECTSVRSLDR